MPAIEKNGDMMVPVKKDKRLFVDDNEESVNKFAVYKQMKYDHAWAIHLNTIKSCQLVLTHGNLLKTKSWTDRPVDPEP